MSILSASLSNEFEFHLPIDFIPESVAAKYAPILEKNHVAYSSPIDFVNSTIKDIVIPSVSFSESTQTHKRGKEIKWNAAVNVYDNFTREIDMTFQSTWSNLNYFIVLDSIIEHYKNPNKTYVGPLGIIMIDRYRDALFEITYRSVIVKSLSELRLSYADMVAEEKTFTLQFAYNYLDINFVLNGEDLVGDKDQDLPLGVLPGDTVLSTRTQERV